VTTTPVQFSSTSTNDTGTMMADSYAWYFGYSVWIVHVTVNGYSLQVTTVLGPIVYNALFRQFIKFRQILSRINILIMTVSFRHFVSFSSKTKSFGALSIKHMHCISIQFLVKRPGRGNMRETDDSRKVRCAHVRETSIELREMISYVARIIRSQRDNIVQCRPLQQGWCSLLDQPCTA